MKNLLETGCQSEISERLDRLSSEDRPLWGRMSVAQMVRHLSGGFEMVLGQRSAKPVLSLLRGPVGRYLGLYSGMPWGRNIKTISELDMVRLGVTPAEFALEMSQLRAVLERFCDASDGELAPMHPIFGRMRRGDWMRWAYLHTDHHLRQFGH